MRPDLHLETRDGLPSLVMFLGLVFFLVVDRTIPDLYVLPVGFSLKVYHLGAMLVALIWAWSLAADPRPLPGGISGLLGLVTVVLACLGPLVNASSLSPFEANAAERGVITVLLMALLFISSHYSGQQGRHSETIVVLVIALAAAQAGLAIFERQTGFLLIRDTSFLDLGFLIPDPGLDREFWFGSNRIGGGGRPVATAPHPIVLSALVSLALLLTISIHSFVTRRRAVLLYVLLFPLLGGLLVLQTRTGLAMLGIAGLATIGILLWRKTAPTLGVVFASSFLVLGAVGLFPSSARILLNQFSRLGSDPSISGRLDDLSVLPMLIARRPVLGAGFLTHNPDLVIFDNSYFVGLVELGVVGFFSFLAFLAVVAFRPLFALRSASERDVPILIAAFVAGVSFLVAMATFDATFFAQFFPTVLVLMALGLGKADTLARARKKGRLATT